MAIYLLRHCPAVGQAPDAQLTAEGALATERVAQILIGITPHIERIVSSPYLRTRLSVEPYAKAAGLEVEVDWRLRERELVPGVGELPSNWRELLRQSFEDPALSFGAESGSVAMARGREVVDTVLNTGSPTLVVTHGNLLTLILQSFDPSIGFEFYNALMTPDLYRLVEISEGRFAVERVSVG